MTLLSKTYGLRHCHNEKAEPQQTYGPRQRQVLNLEAFERARVEISSWPGYDETPLHDLNGLAAAAGVARLWYKDEAGRFGLGSFKALGGAYAVQRILIEQIEGETGAKEVTPGDLLAGTYREITDRVTVTCATDGNHGRSVAWGAQRFGCRCVIYIHAGVSDGRKQAIERYGATIVRTAGNYDDSVRQAAADAAAKGRIVVSDTSYPGYMEIPRQVMQGYTVMADEALRQHGTADLPTHIFIPGGVGGFAAAVCAHYWESLQDRRPRMVVVEPEQAACILETVRAGRPTAVHGDLETIMAGLACGEVSLLAWEVLEQGLDDVLTVPDAAAAECMRLLARGVGGDPRIVAGESATAGLAGLLIALADPQSASALGLGPESRVLLFGSEGATDAAVYQEIVGQSPEEVAAG
jgi:diaminopropionate ammonia-lyase